MRGEKDALLLLSKEIKHETFQGPLNLKLSIGHVATLALGLQLKQGLAKVHSKNEAHESHFMLSGV
jgi:hypothetical protein